jgi:bifunctional oligoribonuclease and PAP phosphatase NrnA
LVPYLHREQMTEAVAAIRASSDIVLACHINPDGDTLGSMLALGAAIEHLGKKTTLLSSDGVPPILAFLPGSEAVQTGTERGDFDLGIVLDAGDLSRVGKNRETMETAPRLMDIDHHVTGGVFGEVRLLDAEAAATGEIVYDLILALGVPISPNIAQNLLCALLTDTGSFRFMNVTPRTMAIAGEMIALGGVPNTIAENVFENKPFAAQKLLGRALESLARTPDGRIVWAHVTQSDFAEFDATDEATEGVVNAVRAVQGAEVAVFFREMPTGKLRVSIRARAPWDISLVAAQFGGGGHRLASGCTMEGPLLDAETTLITALQNALTEQAAASPILQP